MKACTMIYGTHNPYEESHWVSRLRENLTSGSDGEGLETGRLAPRQSFTRQTAFKKIKQNFQLHFFYSDTENGIKTQIWCTLIAHLLLNVIRVLSKSKKAFSTVAALIRIHLISHLDLTWVVTEGRRAYTKRRISLNKSPAITQMALF